jgi:hypothetical protein
MKSFKWLIVLFLVFISCSKEDQEPTRELNISFKSTKSVDSVVNYTVAAYPNPFVNVVNLNLSVPMPARILIINDKGICRAISIVDSNLTLDFSKEKSGTYDCEILSDNTVYRIYLIKD